MIIFCDDCKKTMIFNELSGIYSCDICKAEKPILNPVLYEENSSNVNSKNMFLNDIKNSIYKGTVEPINYDCKRCGHFISKVVRDIHLTLKEVVICELCFNTVETTSFK